MAAQKQSTEGDYRRLMMMHSKAIYAIERAINLSVGQRTWQNDVEKMKAVLTQSLADMRDLEKAGQPLRSAARKRV